MIDYRQELKEVAKRSASLGFTINYNASKRNQLELAYESLKVTITDEEISSRFYIQDTVYNSINYPGFKDIKTPLGAKRILHALAQLQKRYRHAVELHQEILHLADKVDDLRSRMKMLGVIDKSGNDNIAENLVEQKTNIINDPPNVTKRALARLIDKSEIQTYVRAYLKSLRRSNPELYQKYMTEMRQAIHQVRDPGNRQPINPTVVTRNRKLVVSPTALPSAMSSISDAIKTNDNLRKMSATASFRMLDRHKCMMVLSVVKNVFTPQDVNKIRSELTAKTGFSFRFLNVIIGPKRATLSFNISAWS